MLVNFITVFAWIISNIFAKQIKTPTQKRENSTTLLGFVVIVHTRTQPKQNLQRHTNSLNEKNIKRK